MLKILKLLVSVTALIFLLGMAYVSPTLTTALSFIVLSLLTLAVILLLNSQDDESNIHNHYTDTIRFK